jgi:hypothetical protein
MKPTRAELDKRWLKWLANKATTPTRFKIYELAKESLRKKEEEVIVEY